MYLFGVLFIFLCWQFLECQIEGTKTGIKTYEDEDENISYNIIEDKLDKPSDNNAAELIIENGNGNKIFKHELFPRNKTFLGGTRKPRRLFSKLHSGAAFLTGLKLGTILSKKGFELGHGKIASAHSFQLFGKTVNSATSLSYGNTLPLLPVLDDSPNGDVKKQDVFHVTVYENPSNSTVENLEDAVTDEKTKNKIDELEPPGKVKRQVIKLYQEEEKKENESFLKEHNRQVKEFNESILRRTNSKY